ncbi:MAG: response regulator [Thermodesulfovibrionales bacterium]
MRSNDIRVLIADDDPFVSELLSEILQSEGCAVQTAGDGCEAYNKFLADPDINVIISDMNMPCMNGLQLTRKLREENINVPIIILTGDTEIASAIEAIKRGANDYILKDENIQDTVTPAVKKVLEEYNLKQHNSNGHKT